MTPRTELRFNCGSFRSVILRTLQLKCCGVETYSDWSKNRKGINGVYPDSCCVPGLTVRPWFRSSIHFSLDSVHTAQCNFWHLWRLRAPIWPRARATRPRARAFTATAASRRPRCSWRLTERSSVALASRLQSSWWVSEPFLKTSLTVDRERGNSGCALTRGNPEASILFSCDLGKGNK